MDWNEKDQLEEVNDHWHRHIYEIEHVGTEALNGKCSFAHVCPTTVLLLIYSKNYKNSYKQLSSWNEVILLPYSKVSIKQVITKIFQTHDQYYTPCNIQR